MNNLTANFNQVLEFAREYGLPLEKKRGILREYLQALFLSRLYRQSLAAKLIFTGGTSLRLLRNLPRFSEDLDFDNLGLSNKQIIGLVNESAKAIKKENINLEIKSNTLIFPKLLFDLKITTNPKEKLMIKVDYADFWHGQKPEAVLFNRYGFLEMIPALSLNQAVVEKLTAYVSRKQTQGRDIYDVVWLFSQGAKIDAKFLAKNKLKDLVKKATIKWQKEGNKKIFSRRLAPFLFDESETRKLALFGEVLKKL